ncbi:hypothetical protein ACROYT_G015640 [Oculina patagonica]
MTEDLKPQPDKEWKKDAEFAQKRDTDISYDEDNRHMPGQYFWERHKNNDAQLQQFTQNTFAPTTEVLAPFQHQSNPAFIELSSRILPTPCPPAAALPVSADAQDFGDTRERAEGMESGAKKKRSFLLDCGAINTLELN